MMKKALLLLLLPVFSYASGFTLNAGGGYKLTDIAFNYPYKTSLFESSGSGYNIEISYIWDIDSRGIFSLDTRIGFEQNFNDIKKFHSSSTKSTSYSTWRIDTISAYAGTTFNIAVKFPSGSLLMDIAGVNAGWMKASEKIDSSTRSWGNSILLGINLPGGIKYILNNGLMIGFRQKVDMAFGSTPVLDDDSSAVSGSYFGITRSQFSYLSYNITASIGYKFHSRCSLGTMCLLLYCLLPLQLSLIH